MDINLVEYLHNTGAMPDWAYYQQNGRDINENFSSIMLKDQMKRQQEREIEQLVNAKVEQALKNVLEKLFNGSTDIVSHRDLPL